MKKAVVLVFGLLVASAPGVSRIPAQTAPGCDRACLLAIADSYFAALAAHDASKAPMAASVTVSENGLAVKPTASQSLWARLTEGPKAFRIYVPDFVAQEIGGIAMIKVENQPTAIGFRLKVDNGRVTEADHVLVRIADPTAHTNLTTPRPVMLATSPRVERLLRDALRSFA